MGLRETFTNVHGIEHSVLTRRRVCVRERNATVSLGLLQSLKAVVCKCVGVCAEEQPAGYHRSAMRSRPGQGATDS